MSGRGGPSKSHAHVWLLSHQSSDQRSVYQQWQSATGLEDNTKKRHRELLRKRRREALGLHMGVWDTAALYDNDPQVQLPYRLSGRHVEVAATLPWIPAAADEHEQHGSAVEQPSTITNAVYAPFNDPSGADVELLSTVADPSTLAVGTNVVLTHSAMSRFVWPNVPTPEYDRSSSTNSSDSRVSAHSTRLQSPSSSGACIPSASPDDRRFIRSGYVLLALDTYKLVTKALVTSVKGNRIRVHYVGWDAKWEEILHRDSPRILQVRGVCPLKAICMSG